MQSPRTEKGAVAYATAPQWIRYDFRLLFSAPARLFAGALAAIRTLADILHRTLAAVLAVHLGAVTLPLAGAFATFLTRAVVFHRARNNFV